jgi:hypothetical protein
MPPPDLIRRAVIDRTAERLRAYTLRPALLRFFSGSGPAAMWAVEYPAADPLSFLCTGAPLRAWSLTPESIAPVHPDDVDPGEVTGRLWERHITGFFIPQDAASVYVNDLEGPKYGTLIHFSATLAHDTARLKVLRSILLMHGSLVG